jgi:hypothetical protein
VGVTLANAARFMGMWAGVYAAFAALLLGPTPVGADEVGQIDTASPIAAHGGWVVWSAKQPDGFRLLAWHDGRARQLTIRPRARPFDVDVGTDSRGRAVATFSRCVRFRTIKVYEASPREVGAGCRLRVVDLPSGKERPAGVPAATGVSDSMPSMWEGRVAFARRDPRRHRNVDQVMLWSRHGGLRRLPHGAVPTRCPYPDRRDCTAASPSGQVLGLDLGERLLAFSWRVQAPAVLGHGGYEVRADRLADGRSALIGSGYIGEACTGGIDGTSPSVPSVDGDAVWYSQTATDCYRITSRLNRYRGFPVGGRRGALEGIVLQTAKDGSDLYALTAPPNAPNEGPACTPCTIQRIAIPALAPIRLRPHSPFS